MRHILNIDEIKELKENNFKDSSTIRQFMVDSIDDFKFLLENYINKFAFGIEFNLKHYTAYKEDNIIYFRNDKKYKFEFPDCPPSVRDVYCIKTENIKDIISQIELENY